MPKFRNAQVFVIMDDEEITTNIINLSTSISKDTMPTKVSGGITKRIVETIEPVNSSFNSYPWYSCDDILGAWEAIVED